MEHLDTILFVIIALGAVYWFVKRRVLPRSKSARKYADKIRDKVK